MKNLFVLFSVALLFSSCEKIIFKKDLASSDPYKNFNYLWNEVDKKYSYFWLKNIDWDQIKTKYETQLSLQTNEEDLFNIMGSMLNELRDDHSNLISPFNVSRYNVALRHNDSYNAETIEKYYIPNAKITESFFHDFLPGSEVGYIRYSSFMNTINAKSLDYVLTRYKDTKGLILDLRDNGGGSVFNVPMILERFTAQKTLVGYFITRNGPGRNDFGKKANFYIESHNGIKYLKPVVVLIDRGSYSATTMFALAAKSISNITLVGDTTGGGGGMPNGGQLPNGWTYRFSVSQLVDLDGNNYAETGVPPTIYQEFDWSDLTKDKIIEKALTILNSVRP